MNGSAGPTPQGPGGRVERRSDRYAAGRRYRPEKPGRGVVPALVAVVVVLAVAVLSSPFFAGRSSSSGRPAQNASSVSTTASLPSTASGDALLVVTQDGRPVLAELFHTGNGKRVILGIPGISIFRSADGFSRLAELYGQERPEAVAGSVAAALDVPPTAVAAVEWRGLQSVLSDGAGSPRFPESLDPMGADAGAVAAVLAAASGPGADGRTETPVWWRAAALTGQDAAFRAALDATAGAKSGDAWTGLALPGVMRDYGDGAYFEPDLQVARSILAGAGNQPDGEGR